MTDASDTGAITVEVSGEALRAINDEASRRDVPPEQVLAEALGSWLTIRDVRRKGGRVIIQTRDDKQRELVIAT